jgi:hypothetical protein
MMRPGPSQQTSQRQAEAILAAFPGPVTLRTPARRWLVPLATSIVFLMFGVQLLAAPPDLPGATAIAWFIIVLFLGSAILCALMLTPGAGGLTLDRDGFEVRSPFRTRRYPWGTVDGGAVRPVTQALAQGYGFELDGLSGLLDAWRERALSARG